MPKFSILVAVFLVAVFIVIAGHYYFIPSSASPDANWYIKIAQGDINEVIKPFSGRVLQPLIVHLLSFLSGFNIDTSFWVVGVFSLLGFVFMLSLFFSEISFIGPLLAFVLTFSPFLLDYFRSFYLTELFYGFLLILFFYFLKKRNFILSLVLLSLTFITRPVQAVVLGCVLLVVSFYKSEKKFAAAVLVVVLLSLLVCSQINSLGQPNVQHLDNFRYYVLQPVYYFVRSVLGIDWVANTGIQYCISKFWIAVPSWIPAGDIKSIGICGFNINWPLKTLLYPLIAFGLIPLMSFFIIYKNRWRVWKENQTWLLTALIYGLSIFLIAITVPGLRTVGYGWPAFLLAGIFIIDKQIKQWPTEAKAALVKLFVAIQAALLWLPYLIVQNLPGVYATLKYSLGLIVALLLYYIFIRTYLVIAKKYNLVYALQTDKVVNEQ